MNDVCAPQYNVKCIGITSNKELHIIPTAVINNFFNFFDRNGSSESQGMHAEVRVSCLLFPHLVILTIVTSVEQSCDSGKAWSVLLTKLQDLGAIPVPTNPGFLNKCCINLHYCSFSAKECHCSLSMVLINLNKFTFLGCHMPICP